MKVLLTGGHGQLGRELQATCPPSVQLLVTDHANLDITQDNQLKAWLDKHQPQAIINAAAYTAVDKAESDADTAYAINHLAAETLARQANKRSLYLIHISTDFVFDGQQTTPYLPMDHCNPLGVYGESKLAGEQVVREYCQNAAIIRTAWLYSSYGNNFVKTMLRLMRERPTLGVVVDQVGTPTWTRTLAMTIWYFLQARPQGIFHCADNGVTSWYDFAVALQEEALPLGLLNKAIPIKPLLSAEYPTAARRPAYSVLDKRATEQVLGDALPHWRVSLRQMLKQLKQESTSA